MQMFVCCHLGQVPLEFFAWLNKGSIKKYESMIEWMNEWIRVAEPVERDSSWTSWQGLSADRVCRQGHNRDLRGPIPLKAPRLLTGRQEPRWEGKVACSIPRLSPLASVEDRCPWARHPDPITDQLAVADTSIGEWMCVRVQFRQLYLTYLSPEVQFICSLPFLTHNSKTLRQD